jgi:LmbE family N-acetylglucosaminyl deacetylase
MRKKTKKMSHIKPKNVAIIVAHPDDETLWAGGTILSHPEWICFIVSLCRGSDADRAPKFQNALKALNSTGTIADLDDGPQQIPLDETELEQTIVKLLPKKSFDLIITHNPSGEYTRHLRHEEVSKAVINLWYNKKIKTDELHTFAYEDGDKMYLPRAIKEASIYNQLSKEIWQRKYGILNKTYGFEKNSWELQTTPTEEAFWQFTNSLDANKWLNNGGLYK